MLLKDPEKLSQIEDEVAGRFAHVLPTDMSEDNLKRMEAARYQQRMEYYSKFISPGAPFTAADALNGKNVRRDRSAGGFEMREDAKQKCMVALKAFLEVDRRGGNTGEAIARALDEITKKWDRSLDRGTVKGWLDEILPDTEIKRSPRGRPKKK